MKDDRGGAGGFRAGTFAAAERYCAVFRRYAANFRGSRMTDLLCIINGGMFFIAERCRQRREGGLCPERHRSVIKKRKDERA